MATLDTADAVQHPNIEQTRWRIDPARSRVAFRARTYWGLMTVNGEFERYSGTLDLEAQPAIELTIDAASLNTQNKLRDRHLRSADFFDVARHPEVRFTSETASLDGERLKVRGRLEAAGHSITLELAATCAARRRRARDRRHDTRRSRTARHALEQARHDPDADRADRPRPVGPMSVEATAKSKPRVSPSRRVCGSPPDRAST